MIRFCYSIVACGSLIAGPLFGQRIAGTVIDSTTGVPVGRGFVVLVDDSGRELGRALTSADGEFAFDLAGPGSFVLRSERIAYRVVEVRVPDLGADEIRRVALRVPAIPFRLDAIEVESESQCRMRPEEGRNTAALWDEARKALRAASWSAEHDLYVHTLHQYERKLDLRRRRVESETTRVISGSYRNPFRSLDPEELVEWGYIVSEPGGNVYHAPDANTMLHDTFLATHCFRVTRDRQHRDMVGLAFEPIPDRRLPDVAGVLWLDETSAELRTIEYAYRGVPNGVRDDRVGGTIEFLVMPTGAWIVHRWQIRAPRMVRFEDVRTGQLGPIELGGFGDTGGHVTRITSASGELVYESPDLVTLTGTVFDSSASMPLRGATVEIDGTDYAATTGSLGEYEILALLDGEYALAFDHVRLDSLGYAPEPTPVELEPGSRVVADLFVPSEDVMINRLCPETRGDRRSRIVVGMVRNASNGRGVADVAIQAGWQTVSRVGTAFQGVEQGAVTTSDVWGSYVLCDLPMERTIGIRATRDSIHFAVASVRFEDGQALTSAAISVNVVPTARYMPGRIWSMDLFLFPPNCIDRRLTEGAGRTEFVVTCDPPDLIRSRRRRGGTG